MLFYSGNFSPARLVKWSISTSLDFGTGRIRTCDLYPLTVKRRYPPRLRFHIPAYRGYRPPCTHYAKERDFHLSLSCILQAHTWCVLCRCRQFKPDFYIPLLARGIERSAARYDLPRRPHAGLGTYPRVPYVSTPHGTQGFGGRRAVLVILSCVDTRRISQHRIACSARMTRRAREKLWLPLCLMQLRGHVPPSTGRTGRNGGKHEFQAFVLLSITIIAHILLVFISMFSTSRNALG